MLGVRWRAFRCVLVVGLIATAGVIGLPAVAGGNEGNAPLQAHARIAIDGDRNFTAANGVVAGNGTSWNPYVIEGWNITVDGWHQVGVSISNTTAYFVLRDVSVRAPGFAYGSWAVNLTSAQHGTIDHVEGWSDRADGGDYAAFGGISVYRSSSISVTGCRLVVNVTGLSVTASTDVVAAANTFARVVVGRSSGVIVAGNNVTYQISVVSSNGVTVEGNEIYHYSVYQSTYLFSASIELTSSRNTTIRGNVLTNGGIDIEGSLVDYTSSTITADNLVNGKPVRFYKDCANVAVSGATSGQVFVVNCENVVISGLNLSYTNMGVRLVAASNVTIENCTFLRDSPVAVQIDGSSNVTVTGSRFSWNHIAFIIQRSSGLLVTHNDFLEYWGTIFNPLYVYDNRTVVRWDDGYPSGGNFWYDYRGADRCRGPSQQDCSAGDGIGDTPYDIPAGFNDIIVGTDHFPLTGPVTGAPASPGPAVSAWLVASVALSLLLVALGAVAFFRRRKKKYPS